MKVSAFLIVAIGVTLLWLAATGKLANLGQAWDALTGQTAAPSGSGSGAQTAGLPPLSVPGLPTLPAPALPPGFPSFTRAS